MQIITLKIFVPMLFILTHFVPWRFSTDFFCTSILFNRLFLYRQYAPEGTAAGVYPDSFCTSLSFILTFFVGRDISIDFFCRSG